MKQEDYNRKGREKKQKSKKEESPKMEIRKYDANILARVRRDGDKFSLNDLWIIAGCPKNKMPYEWTRLPQAIEYFGSVIKILNTEKSRILKTKRGKNGGTYGIRQIALEYAQYLDTDLGVLVNEVFFERVEEEKNPDLIGQRYLKAYQKKGKSADWTAQRLKSIGTRNTFTRTLAAHGVVGEGFRDCTNAVYEPLYGGTANVIRMKKGLEKSQSIRDNMSKVELAAVDLIEALASDEIERKDIHGNAGCEITTRRASRSVANALIEHKKYIV
nr:MAG TPA: DNA-damage-inducible protein D [Caudoviricetes sp.]